MTSVTTRLVTMVTTDTLVSIKSIVTRVTIVTTQGGHYGYNCHKGH